MVAVACAFAGVASAAPSGWGPDRLAHLAGVICTGPSGSAALASWPSAATSAPAFAVAPVVAGPGGLDAARPAVDATASVPVTGPQSGPLGYLLGQHGRATDPATAGDVAAAVITHGSAPSDPRMAACLAAGTGGVSSQGADALWSEATRLAGPYTMRIYASVGKLVLGQAAVVTAVVTSSSGAPVRGMTVTWTTSEPSARLGRDTAVTDDNGQASTTLTVGMGSPVHAVPIAAQAEVPGKPVMISAPGQVSLVAAGPPATITRSKQLPVDTTADPTVDLAADRTLVLAGGVVHPQMSVSGMRGHSGTATLSVTGPLPINPKTGCSAYDKPIRSRSAATATTPDATVKGDGTFAAGPITLKRGGCYVVIGRLATSDAIPAVNRTGGRLVLAAAPVHPTLAATGHGVSTAGSLSATVAVAGPMPATIAQARGTLLGPRATDNGSCRGATFPGTGTPLTATVRNGSALLSSRRVSGPGCYQFRVSGTIHVPPLGTVAWSAPLTATTLVLAPAVSVIGLSSSDVTAGGRISATVTVVGTWTQPGAVRLGLRRLPYDWRGCFGRNWAGATVVGEAGPPMPTNGDGTYTVRTPIVPAEGCWTVVPVLTLSANPAISVPAAGPIDTMTAFTGLPTASEPVSLQTPLGVIRDDAPRLLLAGVGMLALVAAAVASTLSMARRDQAKADLQVGPLIATTSTGP